MHKIRQDMHQNYTRWGYNIQNVLRQWFVWISRESYILWRKFWWFDLKLTENIRRFPHEIEFAKFSIDVGIGTINDKNDKIVVPEKCLAEKEEDIAKCRFEDLFKTKQF